MDSTRYDRQTGGGAIHVYVCDDSVRGDSQTGGGAIHGRVFVTTVYDATGKQGAWLLMGVSLSLPTVCDTTGNRAGLSMGVSL